MFFLGLTTSESRESVSFFFLCHLVVRSTLSMNLVGCTSNKKVAEKAYLYILSLIGWVIGVVIFRFGPSAKSLQLSRTVTDDDDEVT